MSKPKKLKFSSDYGILDVKKGRKKLEAHLHKNQGVPVVIAAYLTCAYGHDDGISTPFNMDVISVEVVTPEPNKKGSV